MYFKNKFFIFSVLVILPALYFLITYSNKSNATINLNTTDNSVILNGIKIYANNCASCHGKNLQGQVGWQNQLDDDGHRLAPPLNGTAHTWHHSPEYLYRVIKYGFTSFDPNYEGKMLGNSGLSDEEVWELVSYMKEVWPNEINEVYQNRFGS